MMIKFFITISFAFLFSCHNSSIPAVKAPKAPQKDIRLEKHEHKNKKEDNGVYNGYAVEILPKYPGGIQKFQAFIKKNYLTPQEIIKDKASGGVFVSFIIEKDGCVSNIKVLRDFGYGSGKELERVLKLSPNWTPAIKDGNPVRYLYSIPYYVQ